MPIENFFPYEAHTGASTLNKSLPSWRETINTGRITLSELSKQKDSQTQPDDNGAVVYYNPDDEIVVNHGIENDGTVDSGEDNVEPITKSAEKRARLVPSDMREPKVIADSNP